MLFDNLPIDCKNCKRFKVPPLTFKMIKYILRQTQAVNPNEIWQLIATTIKNNKSKEIDIFVILTICSKLRKYTLESPESKKFEIERANKRVILLNDLISKIPNFNPSLILDVGCGDGLVSKLLSNKKIKVIGTDVYEKTGLEKSENFEFHNVSKNPNSVSEFMEPLNQKLDLILFQQVLHHVDNPGILLSNITKYCKQNSIIIIREHDIDSVANPEIKHFVDMVHVVSDYETSVNKVKLSLEHIKYNTREYWQDLLKKLNWDEIHYETFPENINTMRIYHAIYKKN